MRDFAYVKDGARGVLSPNSLLRRLILEESDDLRLDEGKPKCELFIKLLYDEAKRLRK